MFLRLAVLVAVACVLAPSGNAQQPRTLVGMSGSDNVFVWRSTKAMSEGLKLIDTGVHRTAPQLVLGLIACIVPSGSKAVVTDGGIFSSDVVVVSGRDTGCRVTVDGSVIPPR